MFSSFLHFLFVEHLGTTVLFSLVGWIVFLIFSIVFFSLGVYAGKETFPSPIDIVVSAISNVFGCIFSFLSFFFSMAFFFGGLFWMIKTLWL